MMHTRIFIAAFLLATVVALVGCGVELERGQQREDTEAHNTAADTISASAADSSEHLALAGSTVSGAARQAEEPFSQNELIGKFDPTRHPDFVSVGRPYADRPGMLLRRETFDAFRAMWEAARADSISLTIISATRTFAQQKTIWERKWARFAAEAPDPEARALKILEYSSMPGTSRHHWGTDFDLNDLNNPTFEPGGRYADVYAWLQKNAHRFGFCQPYTPKGAERPHGYNEEKWHWSYQPLSAQMLQQFALHVQDSLITGFIGAETAGQIGVVRHYVLGVADVCQ